MIDSLSLFLIQGDTTYEVLEILSVILQYTDKVNYSVLTYLIDQSEKVD